MASRASLRRASVSELRVEGLEEVPEDDVVLKVQAQSDATTEWEATASTSNISSQHPKPYAVVQSLEAFTAPWVSVEFPHQHVRLLPPNDLPPEVIPAGCNSRFSHRFFAGCIPRGAVFPVPYTVANSPGSYGSAQAAAAGGAGTSSSSSSSSSTDHSSNTIFLESYNTEALGQMYAKDVKGEGAVARRAAVSEIMAATDTSAPVHFESLFASPQHGAANTTSSSTSSNNNGASGGAEECAEEKDVVMHVPGRKLRPSLLRAFHPTFEDGDWEVRLTECVRASC